MTLVAAGASCAVDKHGNLYVPFAGYLGVNGAIFCLDSTGTQTWDYTFGGGSVVEYCNAGSALDATHTTLYVLTHSADFSQSPVAYWSSLYALSTLNGDKIWSVDFDANIIGNAVIATPTVGSNGNIYFPDVASDVLRCYDSDGNSVFTVSGYGANTPALSPDGTIIYACKIANTRVDALGALTGTCIKTITNSYDGGYSSWWIPAPIVVDSKGNIYVVNNSPAKLMSCPPAGGLNWSLDGAWTCPAESLKDDTIVACLSSTIYKLSKVDGSTIWNIDPTGLLGATAYSPSIDKNGNVYCQDGGYTYGLDINGNVFATWLYGGWGMIPSPIAISDKHLYYASDFGEAMQLS